MTVWCKTRQSCAVRGGIGCAVGPSMVRSVFIMDAAALLGVSRRTVYYRIKAGRLMTVRTPCGTQRVLVESIQALLGAEAARSGVTAPGADASGTDPSERCPATVQPVP